MSARATTLIDKLPSTLTLGPVELTVLNIDRAVAFYQDVIGLRVRHRDDQTQAVVSMGTDDRDVVVLVEEQNARRATRHAGLYHYALLFESREELANVVLRVAQAQTPVDGASDHGTHEAIYLLDPDGNGIELAWDRPRNEWPGGPAAKTSSYGAQPLDLQSLLSEVPSQTPRRHAGPGLRVGHVHLHVSDLEQSIAFYVDAIGFDLQRLHGETAAFVSAGGYHHHLAFNLWRGRNADRAPDPATVAGLRHWTIELHSLEDLQAVKQRLARAGYEFDEAGDELRVDDPVGIPLAVKVT